MGIAVSLLCLYFATRGTDWQGVGGVLAGASPGWTLALVGVSVMTIYIRAQRWRVLLRPLGRVALYPALSATAIGFGATSVLPFRLGEVLRPVLLGRREGVGISAALSSVVLERIFDMLLVIGCFLVVAVMYPIDPAMRLGAWIVAALAAVGLVVLFAMQRNRAFADWLVGAVLGWLPDRVARGLAPVCTAFLNGLAALADGATVLVVLAYSVYLWAVIGLTFMFGFLALDIHVPLVAASLTAVVVVAAAVFLPQAPGFVGTWQAGCVLALQFFHVQKDVAVGYSLFTWILQMVVNIGAAGVFLAREDMSVVQLVRLAEREAPRAEAG